LNLGERRLPPFDAETREPPQRGALKPFRLGAANRDADGEGVTQVDMRQLARGAANDAMLPVLSARRKRAYADPWLVWR
jgi:hypothetical protein